MVKNAPTAVAPIGTRVQHWAIETLAQDLAPKGTCSCGGQIDNTCTKCGTHWDLHLLSVNYTCRCTNVAPNGTCSCGGHIANTCKNTAPNGTSVCDGHIDNTCKNAAPIGTHESTCKKHGPHWEPLLWWAYQQQHLQKMRHPLGPAAVVGILAIPASAECGTHCDLRMYMQNTRSPLGAAAVMGIATTPAKTRHPMGPAAVVVILTT
ncbi:hypothetical protein EDD22DRAFT_847982 [Suillus occidentalis]|nr:hypothetical protein EDD22DRAFT_847982 [Suillus occidentalis]